MKTVNIVDIILVIVIAALVIRAFLKIRNDRRSGKSCSCGCGGGGNAVCTGHCAGCAGCADALGGKNAEE